MIIDTKNRWLLVTPPHTASRNIHRAMDDRTWAIGPNPWGGPDHHIAWVPPDCAGFRRYLVVRNPFDRLIGMYCHREHSVQTGDDPDGRSFLSFRDFLPRGELLLAGPSLDDVHDRRLLRSL